MHFYGSDELTELQLQKWTYELLLTYKSDTMLITKKETKRKKGPQQHESLSCGQEIYGGQYTADYELLSHVKYRQ